jgi:hypothetical protein
VDLRRTAAEAEVLKRQLFAARAELNGVRGELARRSDRETTLALKLAALEAKEARAAEALAAEAAQKTAARPPEKRPPLPLQKPLSAVERLAAQAGAPPSGVQLAAPPGVQARAANTIETGSVTAASKPDATSAIQLGTGPSVDALRLNWSLLQQRHQGVLQKLQPRYTGGASGSAFDLIAGPLPPAEAQRACDALRAQNVSCKVGSFGGNAL